MEYEIVETTNRDEMVAEINRRIKELWKREGELHVLVVDGGIVYVHAFTRTRKPGQVEL